MAGLRIVPAAGPADVAAARALVLEYAATLPFDLGYQNFAGEMARFPGAYAPPAGRLLLARVDAAAAGCIALRPLGPDEGEVKRLYVRPEFRGLGLGHLLVDAVIAAAREAGYARLRLDTVRGPMAAAERLYRQYGFAETPSYYASPNVDTVYYALDLASG